jgi:hypothetical protein
MARPDLTGFWQDDPTTRETLRRVNVPFADLLPAQQEGAARGYYEAGPGDGYLYDVAHDGRLVARRRIR